MVDLALNSDLDIHLDGTNDLNTVDGQNELEQAIGISIYRFLDNGIGELNRKDVRKRTERKAQRVTRENRFADITAQIQSYWHEDKPNTLVLKIVYGSDELSELEFNA